MKVNSAISHLNPRFPTEIGSKASGRDSC